VLRFFGQQRLHRVVGESMKQLVQARRPQACTALLRPRQEGPSRHWLLQLPHPLSSPHLPHLGPAYPSTLLEDLPRCIVAEPSNEGA